MQWNGLPANRRGRLIIVIRSSARGRQTSQDLFYISTAMQDAEDQPFVLFSSIKDHIRTNGKRVEKTVRSGSSERIYCSGIHLWHSAALSGIRSTPGLLRITPSEVEQKLLTPVLAETGVAITTNAAHGCMLQTDAKVNR